MQKHSRAFITGGARGLGWAIAEELLNCGWRVVIGDLDLAAAQARADALGPDLVAVALDVREDASVRAAFDAAEGALDGLDTLVNNAGLTRWTPVAGLDWEAWNAVMDVNLDGAARCLAEAGRRMIAAGGGGAILNVASIAAARGIRYRAPYVAAKAALVGLTQTAAVEWAEHGVRVNAIGPGYVATDLVRTLEADGRLDVVAVSAAIPMGRFAAPEEIARAARFLLSADASYITGQTLYVDGGFLANSGIPGRMD